VVNVPLDLTVRLMSEAATVVGECNGRFQLVTSADRRTGDTIEVDAEVVCKEQTYRTTFGNVRADRGGRVTVDLQIHPSRVAEIEGGPAGGLVRRRCARRPCRRRTHRSR
jgi:hypothetical protein